MLRRIRLFAVESLCNAMHWLSPSLYPCLFIFVGANVLPQCAGLPSRDDEAENCVSFEKYIDIDDDIDTDDYGEIIKELESSIR